MIDLKITEEDLKGFQEDLSPPNVSHSDSAHHIYLEPGKPTVWETRGDAQVEFILAFVIDQETQRNLEHAEIEGRVENRILRRKNGISD